MSKNNRICTKSHCACLKAISICAVEKGKKVMIDRSNRSFFFTQNYRAARYNNKNYTSGLN